MSSIDIGIDWDDWFENGGYITGGADFPAKWARDAAAFRGRARGLIDHPYGPAKRQVLDLFEPTQAPQGLVVFVHGGYWLRFDKSYWSHLATGALSRGWAVAIPSYTLAPEARIGAIVGEIAWAIAAAAERIAGPVRLTGHSAGGQLVSRMACENAPLDDDTAGRIDRVISISGVHDLRQLQLTKMNETLHLDAAEALSESPALLQPRTDLAVTAWVGAMERPEFLRQTRMLEEAWSMEGAQIRAVYERDRHHFDVINGLAEPGSPLISALLD
ncbi:MAG: alpha/beta hydrolase [Pseudomonadota bacterium]